MKYLLGVSVAAMLISAGLYKGTLLSESLNRMRLIISFLNFCRTEIEYFEETASEIISVFCNKYYGNLSFIGACNTYIAELDFPDAWKKAVTENAELISDDEKELLYELGRYIGVSDKESQLRVIDYIKHSFEISLEEKREKVKNEKKLYYVTGLVLGIMAFILII